MNKLAIWSKIIWKRLWKKPLFVFSLALIPLFAWGLQLAFGSKDATIKVALYSDELHSDNADSDVENEIIQNLLSRSNKAVKFYSCASLEQLEEDVELNRATCGYVFPENLAYSLKKHIASRMPVVTRYRHPEEFTSRLVDELIYSELYSVYAFELVKHHIETQTGSVNETSLDSLYNKYRTEYTFIEYMYMDGTKNKVLSNDNTNYTLLPLRGMTAVLILLTGLVGSLFWYIDKERHVFVWLKNGSHRIKLLYLIIPAGLGCLLGVYAVAVTGFAAPLPREFMAMLCYMIAVVGFCDLLSSLVANSTKYLALIPIVTVGSVLVCPIFADLTRLVPAVRPLRWITPVTHYLLGLYNTFGRLQLLLYGISGILLSHAVRIRRRTT